MPDPLNKLILEAIQKNGSMSLGEFISMALCHPQYGYYSKGDPFGLDGDFTTAPEVSQMFGEVIGAWVIDIWIQMGKPNPVNLIECGPGRGTLMSDIMRVGKSVEGFIDASKIHLIESSPTLRQKQSESLNLYDVSWYNEISEISENVQSIILGNEFLDALPIEQLTRNDKGWQKRVLVLGDDNVIEFAWAKAEHDLKQLLPSKTQSNQIYEIAPVRNQFISSCVDLLNLSGGVALFIDYGYTRSHYGDTLQAVKKHEYIDALQGIGSCDITSHVDFDAMSRHVQQLDCHISPVETQGIFLAKIGIEHRLLALKNTVIKTTSMNDASEIIRGMDASMDRLIGRDQMGDLFKVVCIHDDTKLTPAGF